MTPTCCSEVEGTILLLESHWTPLLCQNRRRWCRIKSKVIIVSTNEDPWSDAALNISQLRRTSFGVPNVLVVMKWNLPRVDGGRGWKRRFTFDRLTSWIPIIVWFFWVLSSDLKVYSILFYSCELIYCNTHYLEQKFRMIVPGVPKYDENYHISVVQCE